MKRLMDLVLSLLGLLFLSPVLILLALLVKLDSKGPVLYKQVRVGKGNEDFRLWKFRSMKVASDKKGLLTVGNKDNRITRVGYYLRKYKLDELMQLVNVLKGDMSLVGPRPEVRKYVDMYNQEQLTVLNVQPGITDYASLEYINENEILARSDDPEATYINEVMPAKLKLNMRYIAEAGVVTDLKIILRTIMKILR